ncbi:uncharacterized protein At4g06744-like [Euphorbia lathyris]|uniref:uncharacterized protein At4g06744-like n=1 Tax=Euphorbia lathyris TaxID=212925 RepID=UPI003313D0E9
MSNISCHSCFIILAFSFFHSCFILQIAYANDDMLKSQRQALEIIIGGGGGGGGGGEDPSPAPENQDCPPPPPPPCPPPPPPPPELCPPPPPQPNPPRSSPSLPEPPIKSPPPPKPPTNSPLPPSQPPKKSPPPSPKPPKKSPSPPKPPAKSPPPPTPRSPSFFPPGFPANLKRDYYTIQEFKKTITIDEKGITKQWQSYNVCTYTGFTCDQRPDKPKGLSVAAVDFNGYNFGGRNLGIKNFLNKLVDLAIFHLNTNKFGGVVPEDIGVEKINFLYELDLSNNQFGGGFPMTTLAAKNLTFLDIRFNSFYGSIPKDVFKLDLDVLFLNNNQFDSFLPENIGETSAIYLTLANNKFYGQIPSSIGYAKSLREVLFLNNKLSGCLSYDIGFLSKATLFDVGCNKLTGPIPHSFGCLAKMEILNLARNEFFGQVPEMVCKLPNLRNLSLSSNYFTQVGPECMKLVAKKRLDVRNNCILGLPNQREPKICKTFFSKKRQCPNEKSLTIVPCKKNGSNYRVGMHKVHRLRTAVAAPALRTYDALSPDNKLRF